MHFLYPFIIAFFLILISELGDKTQILVLSFSSKLKSFTILCGVALGSLLSHGAAILFGSFLGNIENDWVHTILQTLTYASFIIFGIISFLPSKEKKSKSLKATNKFSKYKLNYILLIASTIAVGEIGDKTFLASIGLGIEYYNYKFLLICGAILGMVVSDSIAICLGKMLVKKVPENLMQKFSGLLFLIFGILGFCCYLY